MSITTAAFVYFVICWCLTIAIYHADANRARTLTFAWWALFGSALLPLLLIFAACFVALFGLSSGWLILLRRDDAPRIIDNR